MPRRGRDVGLTGAALALITLSALLHAGWNLLVKDRGERLPFLVAALAVGGAALALVLPWLRLPPLPPPSARIWVLASGAAHLVYFLSLAASYGAGDLSLVYPATRGGSALLVALAAPLLLGERPSAAGWLGLGLVVCGLLLSQGPFWRLAAAGRAQGRALLWSGLTAAAIAAYTLVDKLGVAAAAPVVYWTWVNAVTVLGLAAVVLARGGWREVRAGGGSWPLAAAVGPAITASYLIFLYALRAVPAAYAQAARQLSLVFGAALGVGVRREPLGRWRLAGALLVAAGVTLLAL